MASRGINKVILIGNLGNDPETRYMQSGAAVTNITVATSETWRDKTTGEQQERTEWHRVSLMDRGAFKLGQIAGEYLKKGSKVYIEGSLQTRKWQDKDGNDRYTTEVKANEMQMLDSRNSGGGDYQSSSAPQQRSAPASNQPPPPPPGNDDFDDDIPF